MSCSYSTPFWQCKTSRDRVLLHHQDLDRISVQYLQGDNITFPTDSRDVTSQCCSVVPYSLDPYEAGLLIILQVEIKVQADFTLYNRMHMVSVDVELQSSCLLLDKLLEESGL